MQFGYAAAGEGGGETMFCGNCGKKIEDGYAFCPACGTKVFVGLADGTQSTGTAAAPCQGGPGNMPGILSPEKRAAWEQANTSEALNRYLHLLEDRLLVKPEIVPLLHSRLYITQRMSAALVNVHQYFFVTQNDGADYQTVDNYTKACVKYALENYKGLPRGLQKGIAVYAVMCQTQANPQAVARAKKKPENHFAAFELPVVVDLSHKSIAYIDSTPAWGFAIWRGVKKTAQTLLLP